MCAPALLTLRCVCLVVASVSNRVVHINCIIAITIICLIVIIMCICFVFYYSSYFVSYSSSPPPSSYYSYSSSYTASAKDGTPHSPHRMEYLGTQRNGDPHWMGTVTEHDLCLAEHQRVRNGWNVQNSAF